MIDIIEIGALGVFLCVGLLIALQIFLILMFIKFKLK